MANVLVYMSDEHNPKFSSVYGHRLVQTPNMERLAAQGTVYENAYCPSPLCLPSRAAFMSGLPVHRIQAYSNCNLTGRVYPSYGGELSRQGVHTTYIGKVDVSSHSSTLGFSEMIAPGDRKPPGDINFRRRPLAIRADGARRANGYGPRANAFARDNQQIDRAVDWLTNTAPGMQEPWTLTVNTAAPHFPHYVTQELWDMYPNGADLPLHGREFASAQHPYAQDLRRHFQTEDFNEEQVRGLRRGYLGRVTWIDSALGRLLDALERSGQLEDTVVIYTSDHGEMLGKFGMWWKCSLYEDSVRVPAIVAGPGFGQGVSVKTPVSLLDVQATLFEALGRTRPQNWWGRPLQDIPVDDQQRVAFAEYHAHGTRSGAFMIRRGRWKLIHNMAAPHQLFDLESDPEELENRFETEPAVAADLEAELRRLCNPEAENKRAHDLQDEELRLIASEQGAT